MSPPASDLFDHFHVELDAGDKPLFRGGERITGNVKIQLKKEVVIQVIRIQFKGRALQKDSKKGRDVEKIFFDKDYVLLERPPGNPEPGNFSWKADFEYSLPFQYILPLGCPSSFEGPDGFVRYFSRVTFETVESKSVYVAKKYFSVYDLDTMAAIDPKYQEPYTYRHTFSNGSCCCKRQVYMEFIMPKRVFYSGEDIEGQMIIDNIGDERIANDIQYNIVERTVKPEINDDEALKYPARVIKTAHVDGSNVEKRKNQIVIGSILIPAAAPVSLPNAVALAALPRDKTSPQLSPDDQASKLFEHESIISQTRKEPVFRIHYAIQLLIGKFIIEIPIVIRPVDSEDVRNTLKNKISDSVQFTTAQVAEKRQNSKEASKSEQFVEPDEHDKIFVDNSPISFSPIVPVYSVRPAEDHQYSWPQLGTFGPNNKLIWHPENKLTKEEKSAKARQAKEDKEAKKRQKVEAAEERKKAKAQKRSEKELLIVTEELPNEEGQSMSVNVESVAVDNQLTPIPSQSIVVEAQSPVNKEEPEASTAVEEKPKKKTREEIRKEKDDAKRLKQEEKHAEKQRKEQAKRELEQQKIDAKRAKQQQKEDQKKAKKEEAERKKAEKEAAKLAKKSKKAAEEKPLTEAAVDVPGPSEEGRHFESTMIIEETVIEQHGNEKPTVILTRTTTEQKDGEEPVTTTVEFTGNEEILANSLHEIQSTPLTFEQPQPITEEIVVVRNGNHPEETNLNGHESHENGTNGTNGKIDGEIMNGNINEDATSLKKKSADATNENQLPTEA